MAAQRLDDSTPWQPGKRFIILPIDVIGVAKHHRAVIDKAGLLRYWQNIAESVADHAIMKIVRTGYKSNGTL